MFARNTARILLRRGQISRSIHTTASISPLLRISAVHTTIRSEETTALNSRGRLSNSISSIYRSYATSTKKFQQASISEDEYHEVADTCLDSLTDSLEQLVEAYDGPDADDYEAEYSSGVLTLRLGSHGTYVINKQPPNKQIWFSSPTSGPKRFDYDSEHNEWFMHKDGEEWNFRNILNRELSEIFNKPITVDMGDS
ncbi:Frataxin [Meira miltonrushii]|uniref:ferroxidase n=1 Tax=Meira miltonrushii TaxID=1280837 RepID=A0A316VCA7_9BASI|nr:Frataxin [Meira miltonrushii]PWN35110.1 Frataxin [Meira miltonrushii]